MAHEHQRDAGDPPAQRREVIYYLTPSMALEETAALPYTDVIVAFLEPSPTGDFTLGLSKKETPDALASGIAALHAAGKQVLLSFGGSSKPFLNAAYAHYATNVPALADQIVGDWVTKYGFDGIDIDYEDSPALYDPDTAGYDGTAFLIALTSGLASRLPPAQRIITHAPQSPYWDPKWRNAGAPYQKIWAAVGGDITWVNNQFYNNPKYDETTTLQTEWYAKIAAITGASKLLFGANLYGGTNSGYLPASQLVAEVIQPLRASYSDFGGVMGWQLSDDADGSWGRVIADALL